jgi:RHS repeat-associated protein
MTLLGAWWSKIALELTQFVFGPHGSKFAIFSGQTLQKAFIPLPGGAQAVYGVSGILYYGHSDHLGSVRLGSTSSRTVSFDVAYAPFGEAYAASGSADPAFTGQRQDTVTGLYDFPAREYNPQGRWPSPDPSGLASLNPTDPQSLNRYAYVRNNPLAMIDPQGLDECDEDFSDAEEGGFTGLCGGGGGGGGGIGTSGSGNGPSGGDQSDQGTGGCGPDDPACLGTPSILQNPPPPLPTTTSQPNPPYVQFPSSVAVVGQPFGVAPTAFQGCNAACTGAGASVTYQVLDDSGEAMMVAGIIPTEITVPPIQQGQTVSGNEDAGTCVQANCAGTNNLGQYTDAPIGFPMASGGSFTQQQNFVYDGTSYLNKGNITWTQTSSNGTITINGSGTSTINVCYPTKCP